ncbi:MULTISPECIES: delta(1)-pyrroline-2-carboxylate reductase family protein [unclassified Herbaspirillum]|uniref:delta(1)-pyrroline-2-carboxylate reductase family protein n=1 Tax=unclassified Herbaspirillum TaxID=2624150 RepID=UPI000E2FA684|nr:MULTISPECIES: delta(1)-pyrroline-2-carboxylate reductase family protein [unclassified Herbaspirillum]RFB67629.1 delta(1)-pyrroline-2-carboxylate reductase family protein [Herbaspirillum sp. 3R-3a1]TFI05235.1 delta(1)-pyrroline-2-carboxylate reductase family protein [Herbaspirillum sp. 3R11]TFI12435.1 delta(1)-pyrroline-2-carboxylate reductase family protein [Herbaspirillum sp. 3R-11]TFI20845.1 delta(1)-pyrroline-2-carboxylate reductase family protein [Herbaspirillum sp. 3C11]
MHILDAQQTAAALPYARLVPALAQAAQEFADGRITAPERQVVPIDANSVLLSMPAVSADLSVTKLITVHGDNARHGLPAIQGEVIVFETQTGRRIALLHGPTVTARRTAAMTLLGIQTLAPAKPKSALLIGTGVQAAAHADALVEFFGVTQFWIVARDVARMQAFCSELSTRHAERGIVASPLAADAMQKDVPATDVLIALTTSRTAVIPARLAPHTLAIGVGAFKPDMVEFPAALLAERTIVVDDLGGAKHEAGDLIQAGVDWSRVRAIGDILAGRGEKLQPAQGLPVFKTVGQASWDLAAARVARDSLQS